jgi:hypothetical protein
MMSYSNRRNSHRAPVHHGQIANQPVPRQQCNRLQLWAAGSLIVVLLWIYYSAQIFLFGPEFKKVYASYHGSHQSARHELLQQDC